MTDIQRFVFDDLPVRILDQDGVPWFVLSDVCAVLGLKGDAGQHARRLDNDQKARVSSTLILNQGGPDVWVIDESGLYEFVMRSDMACAKRFRRWVTAEVLPSLRKTGRYQMPWSGNQAGPPPLPLPPPGEEDHSHVRPRDRFDLECRRVGFASADDFVRRVRWSGAKRRYYLEMDGIPKKPEDFHLLIAWRFDLGYLIWGRRDRAGQGEPGDDASNEPDDSGDDDDGGDVRPPNVAT